MVSINTAISAYKNAANITKSINNFATNDGVDDNIFSGLVSKPLQNSVSNIKKAETTSIANLTKQADITDVVSAITNAENTLKTVVAVRDRLINAWQDLQKMPI